MNYENPLLRANKQAREDLKLLLEGGQKVDIVRVLRVIEYVGPRDKVEKQVAMSLHGEKRLSGGLVIKAVTMGAYPEILENLGPANFEQYLDNRANNPDPL